MAEAAINENHWISIEGEATETEAAVSIAEYLRSLSKPALDEGDENHDDGEYGQSGIETESAHLAYLER